MAAEPACPGLSRDPTAALMLRVPVVRTVGRLGPSEAGGHYDRDPLYPCAHLLQPSLQGIGGEAECRPLTAGVGPQRVQEAAVSPVWCLAAM